MTENPRVVALVPASGLLTTLYSYLAGPDRLGIKCDPITKKNYIIFPIYTKILECVGKDSDVWDNGGRNIKLDQAEFIDTSPLSRDSGVTVIA